MASSGQSGDAAPIAMDVEEGEARRRAASTPVICGDLRGVFHADRSIVSFDEFQHGGVSRQGLKLSLKHQRPAHARKADPGMPSSHANSLAFLATSAALALQRPPGAQAGQSALLAALPLLPAAFLAWLRVALGFHSAAQVLAGAALGAATAAAWHRLGAERALPAVARQPALAWALRGTTALALALFALRIVLQWARPRARGGGRRESAVVTL